MKTIKQVADACRPQVSKTSVNRFIRDLKIEVKFFRNRNWVSDEDFERLVMYASMNGVEREAFQSETLTALKPQQIDTNRNIETASNRNIAQQIDTEPQQTTPKAHQVETDRNIALMIEMLQKELDRKDALLLEERKRVDELNKQLADAYSQIANMGKSAQAITVADKAIQLVDNGVVSDLAGSPAPAEKIIEPDSPAPTEKNIDTRTNVSHSFFQRLFSWSKK